jgi:ATP-dependent DNA helicase
LQRLLRRSDGERWDVGGTEGGGTEAEGKKAWTVLEENELEILLDRSEAAYERAEKGLDAGGEGSAFKAVGKREEGALMEGLKA